jgi:hypothetical protein
MSSATHEIEPAGPDASDAPSLSDGCRLSRTLPTTAEQSLSAERCAAPRRLVAALRDIGRPNVAAGVEQLLDNWSALPQPDSTGAPPADRRRGAHRLDRETVRPDRDRVQMRAVIVTPMRRSGRSTPHSGD